MTAPTIKVDGTITRIVQLNTRAGHSYLRVHVTSPDLSIDVDIFRRSDCQLLDNAMPGDRLTASGSGFHRGSIRGGRTSLTARSIRHQKDEAGRLVRTRPQQLSLFTD